MGLTEITMPAALLEALGPAVSADRTADAMEQLTALQRVCVKMFYLEGVPVKEIAGAVGYSESHVRRQIRAGRYLMRRGGG